MYLQCSVCELPVHFFSSILEPGTDAEIQASVVKHRSLCSGVRPEPRPAHELPHRYFTDQPHSERMRGPCKVCGNGARHRLHYEDGRYL